MQSYKDYIFSRGAYKVLRSILPRAFVCVIIEVSVNLRKDMISFGYIIRNL